MASARAAAPGRPSRAGLAGDMAVSRNIAAFGNDYGHGRRTAVPAAAARKLVGGSAR
ncbi:hypothetical protein LA76x_2956 [Lysobacter antibioticus]|uniref:Uncharacterized protein n=1 Tax=Lysobacter antibioticus TaxID=84531 RepID=A0A0S2FC21_LYSAN|nr:hypothetical protein LA76x_2956 [Lysobacter antibioticus]